MNHCKKIAGGLQAHGLDAILLTSPANRFYATGFSSSAGVVLLTKEARYFLTDSRYIEAARRSIEGVTILELERGESYKSRLASLARSLGVSRLGFEEQKMTVAEFRTFEEAMPCSLIPAQALPSGLRAIKSREEVAAISKAQSIAEDALEDVLKIIRPGVTELEVAAELTYRMRLMGGQGDAFDPIVVSGPNSSMPHGVPGQRAIEAGDFVTMDFGCIWGGYCSDMTRTVAVGAVTEEMEQVYQIVRSAQEAGIQAARGGVPGKTVDAAARKVIADAGYGLYFGHGFGHSLGLEIHESPNCNTAEERLLPVGAVVSAEPGIYLPGKFGVRIEDMLYITSEGCENLTHAPKDLMVL